MDERGVALRQTHRVLLFSLATVAVAIIVAVCLLVWAVHTSSTEPGREVARAMDKLAAPMPKDARLVKSNNGGTDRTRSYKMPSDLTAAEGELVTAFENAGFRAEGGVGSSPGEAVVTVVVPHTRGVNVEPIRLRAGDGGTTGELFVTFED